MLLEYRRERLPIRLIAPLSTGLALASASAARGGTGLTVLQDAGLMALLLGQFRLWDDLADRLRDRQFHPGRVLVRATSVVVPRVACGLLALLTAGLLALTYPDLTGLLAFVTVAAAALSWYARRAGRTTLGDHVVLAKYPAFVTIVALARGIDRPLLLLASATAVYFAACVYEAVHDPTSPARRYRALVACESALLVVASAAAAIGVLL
jgi:4-hydroxybenzoate polyprenyltransferase